MWATRRELNMLAEIVKANQVRLNQIDDMGTKGVGIVQSQLNELIKDFGELKGEMSIKFEAHDRVHESEKNTLREGRRWIIGMIIAALATTSGVIGLLIEILSKLH